MKRLIAVAGAAAMLLSAATPAFASSFGIFYRPQSSSDTTNKAYVNNSAVATSSTGNNYQMGGSNWLITGTALSNADAVVIANTNVTSCKDCRSTGDVYNKAYVNNSAGALSSTGNNSQTSFGGWCFSGSNHAITGMAGSSADAWAVVNTNWSY
jgi:hypothetical protein